MRGPLNPVTYALALGSWALIISAICGVRAALADHAMCGLRIEQRAQTVSIDPDMSAAGVDFSDVLASFVQWNELWQHAHGYPIFATHYGDWQDADILLTDAGPNTWVHTGCQPNYSQRGNNHAVVFLGTSDAWRNRDVLTHELGHALYLADHGPASAQREGHINYKPCADYLGVMCYGHMRANALTIPGFANDVDMVKSYWE